jgi:periplasmic divalent cation tolerance protein
MDERAAASVSAVICYVTVASREEALAIARTVVEERLAAAANVIDGVSSIYWWQDAVRQSAESLIAFKTRRVLLPALGTRLRQLHSYQCPAIVAVPIAQGDADYLRWIERETRPA